MLDIVIIVSVLLVLAILVAIFRVHTLIEVARGKGENEGSSNRINAALFLAFFLIGTGLFVYYSVSEFDRYTVPVASEHGEVTSQLFWITSYITALIFVLTHGVMFWFAFKYQNKPNNKAYFYSHNNTLELIWTLVPAVVLTGLILFGLKSWTDITDKAPDNAEVIEIFGFQYAWASRYPGEDGVLGKFNYQLIDDDNKLGVDFTDDNAKDDFMPREIHIPKGRPVLFKIRARDVIHSVYVPHFRLQMNAVPGMPTQFWFIPTMSTKDMREQTNNPDFKYELVCNKICGKAHFGMRAIIVVDELEDYLKWKKEQTPWLSKHPEYEVKVNPSQQVEVKLDSKEAKASLL